MTPPGRKGRSMRRYQAVVISLIICVVIGSCSDNGTSSLPDTDPPVVNITDPADGDTIYSDITIRLHVEDRSDIARVTYHIDDDVVGEDVAKPYEEIWYAGYWEADQTYRLCACAEDAAGNTGCSDTLSLFVSPSARIVPEPYQPADSIYIAAFTTLTFACAPCPGANGYMVEWHCRNCNCASQWCGNLFLRSATNQVLALVRIMSTTEELEIEWRIQALWSEEHVSAWSQKRLLRIRADP